jgi:malate dehydrogenase (quinone)
MIDRRTNSDRHRGDALHGCEDGLRRSRQLAMIGKTRRFDSTEERVARSETDYDVALIGGGIMSATLGTLLKQLRPDWSIVLLERLDEVARESSDG